MKYTEFCKKVAKLEQGKKQVDIAQIREILRAVKGLLQPMGINLVQLIRKL